MHLCCTSVAPLLHLCCTSVAPLLHLCHAKIPSVLESAVAPPSAPPVAPLLHLCCTSVAPLRHCHKQPAPFACFCTSKAKYTEYMRTSEASKWSTCRKERHRRKQPQLVPMSQLARLERSATFCVSICTFVPVKQAQRSPLSSRCSKLRA